MPSLAKRACSTPGCRGGASGKTSRCNACEQAHQAARGTTTARGYDEAHRRLRILAFQRDGWRCIDCAWRPPIIVECEVYGLDEPPLDVILDALRHAYNRGQRHLQGDHIIAIDQRPDLRLDLDNYATRCNLCHNVKTARGIETQRPLR